LLDGDTEPVMIDLTSTQARDLETGQPVAITVPAEAIRIYA
jgi:hypothetical protein